MTSGLQRNMGRIQQNYSQSNSTITLGVRVRAEGSTIASTPQGLISDAASTTPRASTGYTGLELDHRTGGNNANCDVPSSQPVGMLERSRTFFPEGYTSHPQVPNIIVTSLHQSQFTGPSSINFYRVVYFQTQRS